MIEVLVTETSVQEGRGVGSRTIGILRFNDTDPSAEPEQSQPLDGKTLAVIMGGLRKIAAEHAKAWEEFGSPTQGGPPNGGSG